MTGEEPQFIEIGTGESRRRIAYRREIGNGSPKPGLFWLAGLKSDMASTKATALAQYAALNGVDCVRFDYSGHGLSDGPFENGTIGRWLEEAETVFERLAPGPRIIVGSSTGGYLALLLLRRLLETNPTEAKRIAALVLIAPAWDLTEELMWNRFSDDARREILIAGRYLKPSDYGEPYTISRSFIEEGRSHLLSGQSFDPGCRVLVLQGLKDDVVPADHVRGLANILTGGRLRITEVPDGDHRLSRPEDLTRLFAIIDEVSSDAATA
jgi:pimeloyl-ACP methyl ester carboxylesterase